MRLLLLAFISLALFPGPSLAQTSVGFEDPGDIRPLLDYRLPTWSYRTWDATFSLNGGGHDARLAGEKSVYNNFNTGLGSDFLHYRESEICTRTLQARVDADYARSHSGYLDNERSGHRLDGRYSFGADVKRYLAGRPFAVIAGLNEGRSYGEDISWNRSGTIISETEDYSRNHDFAFTIGAAWGKVRNVVPLIRAQRLNERLAAMGYRRLNPDETQQVAQVIATEYGYRQVFDRRSRHFWKDVLEPLLGEELDPYEIYYLADVLNENVGTRSQGTELSATWEYQGGNRTYSSATEDDHRRIRNASIFARWYHNLSLNHQLMVGIGWGYSFYNRNAQSAENGSLTANLSHQWNVADRHLWTNSLSLNGDSRIDSEIRERDVSLQSNWTMYIEDQLSLQGNVRAQYSWDRTPSLDADPGDDIRMGWNWGFGVSVVYHLDRSFL